MDNPKLLYLSILLIVILSSFSEEKAKFPLNKVKIARETKKERFFNMYKIPKNYLCKLNVRILFSTLLDNYF